MIDREPDVPLVDGSTFISPALRPDVLGGIEQQERRKAIEAVLFGVSHTAPSVGRYRVLERLGSGGMGTVYAAYDEHLDRKIAIKLIRTSRSDDDEIRQRTLREARVLARLSHPNVVHVYEVGEVDSELFVAMEFMAGPTLRAWLDAQPNRRWQEVLPVLCQAGEGLAAAHAIGIIHRDFKPHNAMLGADSRVRVLDFGLAGFAVHDDEAAATLDEGPIHELSDSGGLAMTRSGVLLGTPAYMAPEQLSGKPADARSDQFGFCVVLYEALYGERPFAGQTLTQLRDAVCEGKISAPPSGTSVPAWLRKVVLRGLSTDPTQRYPSMRALLAALADDPAVRRRNWVLRTAGAGLFVGLLWGVWSTRAAELEPCTGMDAKLVGVWDDARRAEVEAAVLGSGSGLAASTWPRITTLLDDYTAQWVSARTEACQASVRAEQSDALLDRRMACLDDRLVAVRATVDVLAEADASVVEDAVAALSSLPRLDRCADLEALQAERPPPEDEALAREVAALDQRVTAAWAVLRAGKLHDVQAEVEAIRAAAEPLAWGPLTVSVLQLAGRVQDLLTLEDGGRALFERQYQLALEHHMLLEAADAAVRLFDDHVEKAEIDDARRWILHADALARASRDRGLQAELWRVRGRLERDVGNLDDARVALERALEMMIEARGSNHPDVALVLNNLGTLARASEQHDEARSLLERALAIEQASLGPDHPEVATTLTNLGNIALQQGKYDEARALHERALDVARTAFGEEHEKVALVLGNLANLAHAEGKRDEAREYDRQVLEIRERVFGPKHPAVAIALINVGSDAVESGDFEAGRASLERALAIQEEVLGPSNRDVALTLINLAELDNGSGRFDHAHAEAERAKQILAEIDPQHPLLGEVERILAQIEHRQGRHDLARTRLESALAVQEAKLGPDHPRLVGVLLALGTELLELDLPADAIAPLTRGLALVEANGGYVGDQGDLEDRLAHALWSAPVGQGRDRERALQLADAARAHYLEADGESYANNLAGLEAWLVGKR